MGMRKLSRFHLCSIASLAALAVWTPTVASQSQGPRQLGKISFPNSGDVSAQAPFIEGVLLLHSFEFDDAARSFRRAQEVDPDFALAYWGEAMTYNHPLWRQQDRDAALGVLSRYAPTAAARAQRAPTAREADYLATLDVLYGEGTKSERDAAYMQAMARLSAKYPEDDEARAFHSLSVLGSTDGERDFATYMRAAAIAQPVFDRNPDHPGAAHYLIHSFDDPIHAPLGVEAARAYAGIAPDAGHAQHMTSHIFVAMGMWDDVVAANIRARDVQNAGYLANGGRENVCGHYTYWLHYGWLMRGEQDLARQGMDECRERVLSGTATASELGYFVSMRARHVFDTGEWAAADRFSAELDLPGYLFVDAVAAFQAGDLAKARHDAAALREHAGDDPAPRMQIALLELDALLALPGGDHASAIAILEEAAAIEEELPFEFGPPASLLPPHELLGRIRLLAGDADGAVRAYRAQLALTPERATTLEALVEAARVAGDTMAADDAESRLAAARDGGGT